MFSLGISKKDTIFDGLEKNRVLNFYLVQKIVFFSVIFLQITFVCIKFNGCDAF
jgi:hypothetical protein